MRRARWWLTVGVLALAALAVALVWPSPPVKAQTAPMEINHIGLFGMTGLARGQTARLNVARVDVPPPDNDMPLPDCMVAMTFRDMSGEIIMDRAGNRLGMVAMLGPGESAFTDLPAADAFFNMTGLRRQFRAFTAFSPPPDQDMPDPCADAIATLEIFDNLTGRTMIVYNPPPDQDSPPPDGDFNFPVIHQ